MIINQHNLKRTSKPHEFPRDHQGLVDLGRVLQVHQGSYTIDVSLLKGGELRSVPVLSPYATSDAGIAWLPIPDPEGIETFRNNVVNQLNDGKRALYAIIIYLRTLDSPICIGFLYPETTEMLFSDSREPTLRGSYIFRHQSGTYVIILPTGDVEVVHPSGAYLKIGTTTIKTDLTKRNVHARKEERPWSIPQTAPVPVHLGHPSGASVTIELDGTIKIVAAIGKTIEVGGIKKLVHEDFISQFNDHTHIHGDPVTGAVSLTKVATLGDHATTVTLGT